MLCCVMRALMGYDTFRPNLLAFNGSCLIVIPRQAGYTVGFAVDFLHVVVKQIHTKSNEQNLSILSHCTRVYASVNAREIVTRLFVQHTTTMHKNVDYSTHATQLNRLTNIHNCS